MKYLGSNGWAIFQPPKVGKSRRFELVFSDTRTKSFRAQKKSQKEGDRRQRIKRNKITPSQSLSVKHCMF